MDQRYPFRRPRAKAIAISARVDERRKAAVAAVTMTLVSMAVVIEAALMAHRFWAASHP